MADYMQALRSKDETPGSLMSLTREAEEAILDKYKAQVVAMQEGNSKNLTPLCQLRGDSIQTGEKRFFLIATYFGNLFPI